MLSLQGKTPTLRLLLEIVYRCSFAKIYVTLNEISLYKISTFEPLKLDESRYIMKDVGKLGAGCPPGEDVVIKIK